MRPAAAGRAGLALAVLWAAAAGGAPSVARAEPPSPALERAGRAFRAGDAARAQAILDARAESSPRAARADLALRFLEGDYAGVLALAARRRPTDDEARLWVARAGLDLGRPGACLAELGALQEAQRPWPLCLRAEALTDLGNPGAGAAWMLAVSAAAGTNLEADAARQAGDEAFARGDLAQAQAYFLRSQRADPAYASDNLRLAEVYLCEDRPREALGRLERQRQVEPGSARVSGAIQALLASRPSLAPDLGAAADAALRAFDARPVPRVPPLARLAGEPLVRVGLLNGAPYVVFRLGSPARDAAAGVSLAAGVDWLACAGTAGSWTLAPFGANPYPAAREFPGPLRLALQDPGSTFGLYRVPHGQGYFFAGTSDRYYRGLLEVGPRRDGRPGLLVVDELGLEAYLRSVVPSEVPAGWPAEALKAQAVAARTAAWDGLGQDRKAGYDITEWREAYSGAGVEARSTDQAVLETRGVVLVGPSGGLDQVYYMDDSGGHTVAASAVWPGPDPGSVGVADCPASSAATLDAFPLDAPGLLHYLDDPYGDVAGWCRNEGSSAWRWILRRGPRGLSRSAERVAGVAGLRAVQGLERDGGGTLESVLLVGVSGSCRVSGDRIRRALRGLKSNLFYAEERHDSSGAVTAFLFHGGGWGHGVGLSQSGARSMAAAGLDDHAILRHYYPRDRIVRRYPYSSGTPLSQWVFSPPRGRGIEGQGF